MYPIFRTSFTFLLVQQIEIANFQILQVNRKKIAVDENLKFY